MTTERVLKYKSYGRTPGVYGPCEVCGIDSFDRATNLATGQDMFYHAECNSPLIVSGGHVILHTLRHNLANTLRPNNWGIGESDRSVISKFFADPLCKEHLNLRKHGRSHEYYEWLAE